MTYPIRGEFPDFEQVLVDLCTHIRYTCSSLPKDPETLAALIEDGGLILARRTGGAVDAERITDRALVQLTCMTLKRSDSQDVARQVRNALSALADGGEVNGVLIDYTEETSGVLEQFELDPLKRDVEVGFVMTARRQW
jgi:hypothetical protein